MKHSLLPLLAVFLLSAGCSTMDAINPFSSNSPKMTALVPITQTISARVAWSESVGKSGEYALTPAIAGSTIYAASRNGQLMRIDNGQRSWSIDTDKIISGAVGASEKTVVVGTLKGELLAFDAADGKALWTATATSEVLVPPALAEGLVIVRSGDNRLAAYDEATGQRKWIFQRPTPPLSLRNTAQPLIDEKYILAGFPGGKVVAINLANGTAAWDGTIALPKGATELERVVDITSKPVIAGGFLCAVAFQGRVSCFDLKKGNNLAWSNELSSDAGLAIDERHVYVTDDKGTVHAFDLLTGTFRWKQDQLSLRRVTGPQILQNYVVVADIQGIVHFLDRESGAFAGRLSTDGSAVLAPLQVQENRLILQTVGGGIFSIEIE